MRCSQPSRPESRLLALRDNSESLSPMCEKCWCHNLEDLEKADNLAVNPTAGGHGEAMMSKAISKEGMALLKEAGEMFNETGCVPGIDGEEVRAEAMVPDAKEYISESIDNPEVPCDTQIWDTPGFTLVLSWLAQKWLRKCHKLAPRETKNPEQYLTKEQQKACLDSAAAELIREIAQQRPLN